MSIFRGFVLFICLFSAMNTQASEANKANQAFRSFWHPTFLGYRLDYCTVDGKECGKQVAHRYCKMLGYEYSSQSSISYNVGLTHFIASRAQCQGWRCNGFMVIDCARNLTHKPPRAYHYTEKKFVYPRFNEYRVDWCYKQHKDCGSRAANSFCSRMGYMNTKGFIKESGVGATRTVGSQELCFGNQCNGFKSIVCSR